MDGRKTVDSLKKVSIETDRTLRLWLQGEKQDLKVYRIPIQYLYFNIENGRYADKMLQLKADNPGVNIDPKEDKWRLEIYKMLKGDYVGISGAEGTEGDRVAFDRLMEDMKTRDQLSPGIVLSDGGVIDGNRRLAVLITLCQQEKGRFTYFEGVILPEDINALDRWRIEVGAQLGKDQKLDYSPINQLLKIREGLELYKLMKLPGGKKPEDMVADALYGVFPKEIIESIDRINLIDEYLDFFKMKGKYFCVADKNERFIEAVNVLKAAERLAPHEKAKLKVQLFIIIKEEFMSNWEIRNIRRALGGDPKSRGKKPEPIEKAISHLILHSTDPKMVRDAYINNTQEKIKEKTVTLCREFKDIFEAEKDANQPLFLVKEARTRLGVLKESLKDFKKPADAVEIKTELENIKKIVKACLSIIKLPKHRK
jgi:hypothetical protein